MRVSACVHLKIHEYVCVCLCMNMHANAVIIIIMRATCVGGVILSGVVRVGAAPGEKNG